MIKLIRSMGTAKRVFALAALSTVVFTGSSAFAVDTKVLPGASCQVSSSGLPYSIDALARLSNPAAGLSTFVCPVVRDSIGFAIADAKVWVIDQNPAANFICTLNMQNSAAPAGGGFIAATSSGGAGAVPQLLDFPAIPSVVNGYSFISCSAPGVFAGLTSRLVAYRVDELP
jgi:hypothetical protein